MSTNRRCVGAESTPNITPFIYSSSRVEALRKKSWPSSDNQWTPRRLHRKRFTPLEGGQYAAAIITLGFGLVLSLMETSITATALVTISNYFHNPIKATWVVLSYLLSYMGFTLIFARLSDGIGRRNTLFLSWLLFGAFSTAGGLAKSLNSLIGLRVLQGVGGSGLYTMTFVIGNQVTPIKLLGVFGGAIGAMTAIGSVLGPILGGVITQRSTWRWVYLFNGPCAILGLIACALCIPHAVDQVFSRSRSYSTWDKLKTVDYFGGFLLLAASILLVFALQQAGSAAFDWDDAPIIVSLTVSAACWIGFFIWLHCLEGRPKRKNQIKPIVPLHIIFSRPLGPAIIVMILLGLPMWIAIIHLPQRFQLVYHDNPIMAGVHLLPMLSAIAFGGGVGGALSGKKNLTAHTAILGTCLVLIASGLLSTIQGGDTFDKAIFYHEVVLGFGCGLVLSSVTMMVNLVVTPENNAAAQGTVNQARILGGSIGLAVATVVFNHNLVNSLGNSLEPSTLRDLQQTLHVMANLTMSEKAEVVEVYSMSFNQSMRICTYVAAFCVLAAIATWQRNPVDIADARKRERLAREWTNRSSNGRRSSRTRRDMEEANPG